MDELEYVRAGSLVETLELLNQPGGRSRILAGGTDLIRHMSAWENQVDCLIDVSEVRELRQIERLPDGAISLGAAVTLTEILENRMLAELVPLLADGCRVVGGPQVRNQATPGGNVANGAACADIATVLVCLDAIAVVDGPDGEGRIPIADLLADLPGRLPPTSVIRAFEFMPPRPQARTAFLRLAPRKALSIARVSLAVLGSLGNRGEIDSLRLAWGAVFPHPRRTPEVEALMLGEVPSESLFAEAGEAMEALFMRECGQRWSAPFKRRVVAAFAERGLRQVFGSAP